jgi:hypothetical protein
VPQNGKTFPFNVSPSRGKLGHLSGRIANAVTGGGYNQMDGFDIGLLSADEAENQSSGVVRS